MPRASTTPNGHYNLERILKPILRRGRVILCGSCMDARGIMDAELAERVRRSTMDEFTPLAVAADEVVVSRPQVRLIQVPGAL